MSSPDITADELEEWFDRIDPLMADLQERTKALDARFDRLDEKVLAWHGSLAEQLEAFAGEMTAKFDELDRIIEARARDQLMKSGGDAA